MIRVGCGRITSTLNQSRGDLCRRLGSAANASKLGKVVTITSGKGGVGKTTTAASFAYGLAEQGHKTVVIDFDIGLRNLDIHLGCERRVIFDFVNVLQKECTLSQALIKDKRSANLSILAASQTKDKNILTEDGVGALLDELRKQFDYIVCDSPAGIESGARHAMYFAGSFYVLLRLQCLLGLLVFPSIQILANSFAIMHEYISIVSLISNDHLEPRR